MPLQALDDISCSLRAISLVPAEEQVKIDWMAGCYMMIRLTLKLTDNLLTVFKSCTDENISFAGDFLHKGLARLVYNFKLGVDSSYDPGGLFSEDEIIDKATWLRSFPANRQPGVDWVLKALSTIMSEHSFSKKGYPNCE